MPYTIAAIDVHKKILIVVVAEAEQPAVILHSRRFGTGKFELEKLSAWFRELEVREAVMESTAQYWRPVWLELEDQTTLHLAQAQSNRAPKGRKSDLTDCKRLLKRFISGELFLSFVPGPEQRAWRAVTRSRVQLTRERVQLQNQLESLLEQVRIKLSSVISDLLGSSGRRILRAMAQGQTDPHKLAELAEPTLKCGKEVLVDALSGCMTPLYQVLLGQHLDRIAVIDRQIDELSRLAARQMRAHEDAVLRLVEVPGIGAEAAQEIIAELGPTAAVFPSAAQLASWIGVCPGSNESAGQNQSGCSAKGNRFMRRVLCQAAQAAVRTKGSHLQALFQRLVGRLGYPKAVWAVAHRLCRIIWKILNQGARFIERGEHINPKAVRRSITYHLRALRKLGYVIPPAGPAPASP